MPEVARDIVQAARKRPGPVPRSVRYKKQIHDWEQRIARDLPLIYDRLLAAGKEGDVASLVFLAQSLVGKPATRAVAPVDDNSLPIHSLDRQTVEQMTIAQLSDQALLQVKAIVLRDLQARGIIKPDADASIASIDLEPSAGDA